MFEILKFQCYSVYFYQEELFYHVLLFDVVLNNLLILPVVKEKIKVKLALAIPTEAPITVVKEIVVTPQHIADKTIKILSI